MQSYQVLKEAADRVGVKSLAADMRLSPALIYKWCEPPDSKDPEASGSTNPLDRLQQIVKLTGHIPVVSWLCHQANGFFVHNPEATFRDLSSDLLQATQHVVQQFSDVLNQVSKSVADDGAISMPEARSIRQEWEQLKTTAESFVVACEQGVYKKKTR